MTNSDIESCYDRWDLLVLEFRGSKSRRTRNKIFTELRNLYLPKVLKIMKGYPERYRDELLALYNMNLLILIERWNGKSTKGKMCHATSYLYWAIRKAESQLNEKIIMKDRRELYFIEEIDCETYSME